jgi:D-serine deaminase-like pyridoxal phosphate-dependent protein
VTEVETTRFATLPDAVETFDRLAAATADLDPPFAVIDRAAFRHNAAALVGRARGKPIRLASKSVRSRPLLAEVLAMDGFAGVLAYSLPEALWLAESDRFADVLVGYPSADRGALARLASSDRLAERVTLMVDSIDQLDLVDAVVPPGRRPIIRLCLDIDASLRVGPLHLGVRRSPVHTPANAAELARRIAPRPGFRLVGLMSYEAQIAGVGDRPPGRPLRGRLVQLLQRRSGAELAARRAAVVAAVSRVLEHQGAGPLGFVNGGGTGSVEKTSAERAITEVAAGSGLFGPVLFDHYRGFDVRPAALFALPVVRRPARDWVTVAGGGWVASGAPGTDRLPVPVHPAGLRTTSTEGAGEVQTPLHGAGANALKIGDRVWFRHAKAGELCEHVDLLHVVDGRRIVDQVPTYRGEGRAF